MPEYLTKARIASGLTQNDLAERLGLKKQQIRLYEATDYKGASLGGLLEVVRALGLERTGETSIQDTQITYYTAADVLSPFSLMTRRGARS